MAISNNISRAAPYYDDFVDSGNDNKNYLRILFKPGVAVQARELNQIQSQIQNQIDKFGRNVFKENTRVLGGELSLNTDVRTVNITLLSGFDTDSDITSKILDKTIKNSAGTIEAKVIGFNIISGNEYKLFLRYTKSTDSSTGGDTTTFRSPIYTKTFASAQSLQLSSDSTPIGSVTATGHAAEYSIKRGVFFILGSFVVCEAQTLMIDLGELNADGTTLSYNGSAILLATEGVVGVATDSSLYDNALEVPNAGAPGADRYTITLTLKLLTNSATILGSGFNTLNVIEETGFNGNAVTLSTINDSEVIEEVSTSYSELGERLARRTYEESGNYSLNPYVIDVRPHLNDGTNRGKFLSTDEIPGDEGKLVVDIEPNVSYVYGVRTENIAPYSIDLNKARATYNDTYQTNNGEKVDFQARAGNFILADSITGVFDTGITYELFESKFAFDHSSPSERGNASPSVRIGECTVNNVEFDGSKFKVYLNTVSMAPGRELKEAKHLADATFGASALDFSATAGQDDGSKGEGFVIKEPGIFGKVFNIGRKSVKDLERLVYVERTASSTITRSTSDNTVSVTLAQSGGSTTNNTEWFSDNPNDYIIISAVTGQRFPISTTPAISGSTLTLTFDGSANDDNVVVIGPKRKTVTNFTGAKKTIVSRSVTSTITGLSQNTNISLGRTDIAELTSVTVAVFNEADGTTTNNKDITREFILDDGQRPTELLTGSVTYAGETLGADRIPADTTLTINFKHYVIGDSSIPFTVEAYPIEDFDNGGHAGSTPAQTVNYSKLRRTSVPGEPSISVSDVIDFRGSSVTNVDPNGFMSVNVNYHLPRFSTLSLAQNGNFVMTDGQPGIYPQPAQYPSGSLPIFNFRLNAYTHDIGKGLDGEIIPVDNRRYTMRDINHLEDRIQNLEYYTSLSLLETQASNESIFDATNGERFKNGILVDAFTGHNVGNYADSGYNVSIDYEEGILRPAFNAVNMNLFLQDRKPGDTPGISSVDGDQAEPLSRLPAINRFPLVDQPFASTAINVNPYELASFVGEITLSPSSDEWHSTERLDDVVINFDNNYDQLLADFNKKNKNVLGTVWNSWKYNWTGAQQEEYRRFWGDREFGWGGNETTHYTHIKLTHTKTGIKTREGTRKYVRAKTVNKSFGDHHVKTVFVPFIRSRKVYFKVTDLKPNTRVIPFFDEVNIDLYARQDENFVEYIDGQNNASFEPLTNNKDSGLTASDILAASSAGLTTDANGDLTGFFIIPNNDELRFKSGDRRFKLIDSTNVNDPNASTFAETKYRSIGQISTYLNKIISYRVPEIVTERLQQKQGIYDRQVIYENKKAKRGHQGRSGTTITDINIDNVSQVCYQDPLAQSFAVPGTYTNGVFIRDIDLYFKTVSTDLPVKIHLVSMENGYPTLDIVPGSKVRKTAAEMVGQASDNATVATNFRFEHPIYLPPKSEFAIVVMSNSFDYTMWHSTVGQNDITGERLTAVNNQFKITKNPYAGVSFKSQNQSTWTADQNTDFKFRINMVEFNVDNIMTKSFTTVLPQNSAGSTITTTKATSVCLLANQLVPAGTRVDYILEQKTGNTTLEYPILPGGDAVQLRSQVNPVSSSETLKLKAQLSSLDKFVTPMVDLERMSFIVFNNVINNDATDETLKNHGDAQARYVTRKVVLDQASTRLDVFFDLSKPDGTDVKVYAQTDVNSSGTNSTEAFEELSGDNIPVNSGRETGAAMFSEVHFTLDLTRNALLTSAASTSVGGFTTGVDVFKEFTVKLVLLSSDPATIPQVRNLRCIATV